MIRRNPFVSIFYLLLPKDKIIKKGYVKQMMNSFDFQQLFEQAPELNYEVGFKYFLGNFDSYKRGLLSCIKSIQHKLPILLDMLENDDYTGLGVITKNFHKIMTNIGAIEIATISYKLEVMELNSSNDDISALLEEYIDKLNELSLHMKAMLQVWNKVSLHTILELSKGYQNYQDDYLMNVARL